MSIRPAFVTTLALTALLLPVRPVSAPAEAGSKDCKVSLSATLNNTKPMEHTTRYTYGVAVNSAESCADVHYVLVVTEQHPDGSTHATKIPGDMRVRSQTRIEAVPFTTDSKNVVKDFQGKMVSCHVCDAP
ncbi:MAG TPA: hypothetical protein VGQ67_00515 [Candidatus Polarisedimenticolia bacterium]|jgi:hypothetical protein|nr:hypothetical protein [Candidatus Polarisedimenticolia bacterium]